MLSIARISPDTPDAAVPTPMEPNWTLAPVLMLCGSDRVTDPVEADAVI